jgi:MarR family transcriptional regulator, organic hydroperoxide resistance regulator
LVTSAGCGLLPRGSTSFVGGCPAWWSCPPTTPARRSASPQPRAPRRWAVDPIEELRFLILAIQRDGQRLFAAELRPLGITPSQAEVLRVLADHQPLTLQGLGELLVCETGTSPSRLVDRLVDAGAVRREVDPSDRRQVTLHLTENGQHLANEVAEAEHRLHHQIALLVNDAPLEPTLALLRSFAGAFPAAQALARRITRKKQQHDQ